MKTGHIIGGLLIAAGVGAGIYFGFVKKFDDGLTGWQKLTKKKDGAEAPAPSPTPDSQLNPPGKPAPTKPKAGRRVLDASNNPHADLGLITSNDVVKKYGNFLNLKV